MKVWKHSFPGGIMRIVPKTPALFTPLLCGAHSMPVSDWQKHLQDKNTFVLTKFILYGSGA